MSTAFVLICDTCKLQTEFVIRGSTGPRFDRPADIDLIPYFVVGHGNCGERGQSAMRVVSEHAPEFGAYGTAVMD